MPTRANWFELTNPDEVPSPALLIYPDRVEENIRQMIRIIGDVDRLRPHMKTHKLPRLIQMQLELGIRKFKCATIAEAEMVADCRAPDVLLAYQPVGPNVRRMVDLVRKFPGTKFSAVVDDPIIARQLSDAFDSAGLTLDVLLDFDCGMHRTGIAPGPAALDLYKQIASARGLRAGGLHCYDGHLHQPDLVERTAACHAEFASVELFAKQLLKAGLAVPRVVAGGTPTFPIHAQRPQVECSPGTCVLWDSGYGGKLKDMNFSPAAVLLTRVVSKPAVNRLCLDLGHKAVASENPHPRVEFLNLPESNAVVHSEEHLVVETPAAAQFCVGDCIYGIPRHICPTVALHAETVAVKAGRAVERWKVTARNRILTV